LGPRKVTSQARVPRGAEEGLERVEVFGEGLQGLGGGDEGAEQAELFALEALDVGLDGLAGDEPVDKHRLLLPNPVDPVNGLLFGGGVPPGIEEEDVVGGVQGDPGAASLEGGEEDGGAAVFLERAHGGLAVAGGTGEPVQVEVGKVLP